MPDTNEEQLLSDLLGDIAKADEHLTAPDEFARRVLAAWDTRDAQPPGAGRWTMVDRRWPIADYPWAAALGAAALCTVVLLAASAVMRPTATTARIDLAQQRQQIARAAPQAAEVMRETTRPLPEPMVNRAPRRRPAAPSRETLNFVPLVPMTADELSGSFSIARVQIGRTEADVLLGEDGMARAIRVATDRNVPWRFR